jgi:hypothetical protein
MPPDSAAGEDAVVVTRTPMASLPGLARVLGRVAGYIFDISKSSLSGQALVMVRTTLCVAARYVFHIRAMPIRGND